MGQHTWIRQHRPAGRFHLPRHLPVSLLRFDAVVQGEQVALAWETTAEVNFDDFTVEKSSDSQNWLSLQVAEGWGTPQSTPQYATVDPQPFDGLTYYRLKQTDLDGKSTYSEVVAVAFHPSSRLVVSPNPAKAFVVLGNAGAGDIDLFASDGR